MTAMRDMETQMLEKGYASARMVAAKIKLHFSTVLRLLKQGKLEGVQIGPQNFIKIESVLEYMGKDAVELFDLHNWANIELPDQEPEEPEPSKKKRRVG